MKIPFRVGRFLLNSILVLNVAALVIVDLWFDDLITLHWILLSVLAVQLILRWPEELYWWDKGHRRR